MEQHKVELQDIKRVGIHIMQVMQNSLHSIVEDRPQHMGLISQIQQPERSNHGVVS